MAGSRFGARRDGIGPQLRVGPRRPEQRLHRADAHRPQLPQAADRRPPLFDIASRIGDDACNLGLECPQLVGTGDLEAEPDTSAFYTLGEDRAGRLRNDRLDPGIREGRAK